jgi:hypothetical protein
MYSLSRSKLLLSKDLSSFHGVAKSADHSFDCLCSSSYVYLPLVSGGLRTFGRKRNRRLNELISACSIRIASYIRG